MDSPFEKEGYRLFFQKWIKLDNNACFSFQVYHFGSEETGAITAIRTKCGDVVSSTWTSLSLRGWEISFLLSIKMNGRKRKWNLRDLRNTLNRLSVNITATQVSVSITLNRKKLKRRGKLWTFLQPLPKNIKYVLFMYTMRYCYCWPNIRKLNCFMEKVEQVNKTHHCLLVVKKSIVILKTERSELVKVFFFY